MKATSLSRLEPPNGYPECEPEEQRMPNSAWHGFLLAMILQTLRWFFRDAERVCVEGDMFVYYERGDTGKCVGPDVFVVCGAEKRWRRNWLTWAEGTPQFVLELVSDSTVGRDTGAKLELYRDVLKVREYFLFDPDGERIRPRLQGYRLVGEQYVRIDPVDGRLPSEVLGLHLEQCDHPEQAESELRFWDPATSVWVPTDDERAQQESARADDEAARADDEATLAATERKRANEAKALAETEAARADKATARADDAEERIRELEAELARRGSIR
jgi:Uma2 family endonuclease